MVTRGQPTQQQKKQQRVLQTLQQTQGQKSYQQKKTKEAKSLFESIGIDKPNNDDNTKWKAFTDSLTKSVYVLYREKFDQYNEKLQEITTDNQMDEFVTFLQNNINKTDKTRQSIAELKKDLLIKFGEKNFELILGKFNKNNECKTIIKMLKEEYNIDKRSPAILDVSSSSSRRSNRSSRLNTRNTEDDTEDEVDNFQTKLKTRHDELYKTLKKIYDTNIGLANYIGILKMLKAFSLKPELMTNKQTPLYINYAITGLPGTGKSYIARLLAKILQHSGILLRNKFSTLESFDFIGEYIGQSGPKTYNSLLKNMESVVFIDEVYTIARCNGDMIKNCEPNKKCNKLKCSKFDQYSTEACTEIVKFISENPGCIAIIVAGYEEGDLAVKNTFFQINEGMSRRFPQNNRIKMKPVLSKDAIAKVQNTLKQYKLTQTDTNGLGTPSKLHNLFQDSLLKLEKDAVLKENYSSLNRIVKDFIEWLVLKPSNQQITDDEAKKKISQLFNQNTVKTTTKIQHVMENIADQLANKANLLTDAQKQQYKKTIQKDKQNYRKKKN